jgi:O-antigen ligase
MFLVSKRRWGKQLSVSSHTVALMVPILGIFVAGAVSLFMSPDTFVKQRSLQTLFLHVFQLLLTVYLADKAAAFGSPARLLGKVTLTLAFASVAGILLSLAETTPLDVIAAVGLPTVFDVDLEAALLGQQDVRFFGILRAQGFFTHPLEYGAVLVLAYSVIRTRPDLIRRRTIRWTVYFLLLLGGFMCGARSVWLGFVLAELLIRYFKVTRGARNFATVVAAIAAFSFVFFGFDSIVLYINSLRGSADPLNQSLAARLADYKIVLSTVRDNPFGIGYFNYPNYVSGFAVTETGLSRYGALDNDYLRFLAETGVFGLLMYVMYVLRVFLPLPYASPLNRDRSAAYVLTGIYAWQAFVFDAFAFQAYTMICAVLITIALRLERVSKARTATVSSTTSVP